MTEAEHLIGIADRGVEAAREQSGLPQTPSAALGGCWEWSWAPEEAAVAEGSAGAALRRRLTVLLEPRSGGVQLSVQSVVWNADAERQTRLKVYSDRFFPPAQLDAERVAAELKEPLAEAWGELGQLGLAHGAQSP